MKSDQPKSEILDSRELYSGRVFDLREELVRLPNGHEARLQLIRHPGAAAIVPLDDSGAVVLVRQYRHATGRWLLEVPAGTLDEGEAPLDCARRELAEEAGCEASEFVELGWIWTTPDFTDERIWLYLARGLRPAAQKLDDDEALSVERLPLEQAVARAERGEIEDAKSVCALLRAAAYLGGRSR
jgi:ADP-ribose pyrophosphatase